MNTITLEMVDAVIERTGASYTEAKEALTATDGNVLDAIVQIEADREEAHGNGFAKEFSAKTNEIVEKVKELIKKGNVTSLIVERESRVLLDIPVTLGGVAAIAFAIPTLIGAIVAFGTGCVVKIKQDNGEIINVSDAVYGKADDIKSKFNFKDTCKGESESSCCEESTDKDVCGDECDRQKDDSSQKPDEEKKPE